MLCTATYTLLWFWFFYVSVLSQGATSSQINSLGSIQVTWLSVGTSTYWKHKCFLPSPSLPLIHYTQRADRIPCCWTIPSDHMWSFICTGLMDMTAHTPAFIMMLETLQVPWEFFCKFRHIWPYWESTQVTAVTGKDVTTAPPQYPQEY